MRILFISTDWTGLAKPVADELSNQGHNVTYLDHSEISYFSYKNNAHRALTKISDVFRKKKYKHLKTEQNIAYELSKFFSDQCFDLAIFTNPDIFVEEHFNIIRAHIPRLHLMLWDSLGRMPQNREKLPYFDKVFSFDPIDAAAHNLEKVTNYYRHDQLPLSTKQYLYDVFCIMSFCKQRYPTLVQFLDKNPNLNSKILLYIDHPRKRKYIRHPKIEIIEQPILNEQLLPYVTQSKCILDIGYQNQRGLSFRVLEALAWERKLITTNTYVSQQDFYNSNNIHVLDIKNPIPIEFIKTDYLPVAANIKQTYRIDNIAKRLV
ncbi:hypothetical protein SNR37_001353 [Agarivorans aestuarii]|uniref:Glycosyltransferase n=1 Tax=Agarivorans aestuarii TaxID=1563703 RepID=A0ABU7G9E0_9ALTE|nr:hypothetical protein [Agarivorans aestuarii]MEE1676026.1 hypothetical protein [Agarivorans aestuarii]